MGLVIKQASVHEKIEVGNSQTGVKQVLKDQHTAFPVDLTECEHPAVVGVTGGVTRNIGDYNSVRLSVNLSYPCHPGDIDPTFEAVKDWVGEKVHALLDEQLGGSENG